MSNQGAKMPNNNQTGISNVRQRHAGASHNQISPNELRLVLLGRTGAGKSATGNTILGNQCFDDGLSMSSVTKECQRECATVEGRELVLVDTPGFFDTNLTDEEQQKEVVHCMALSSPGPHAFLLVVPIERYTEEQQRTVEQILEMFHEGVSHHTILIFSHAERLGEQSIEEFISRQDKKIQELVERFGRRFVAFDNKNRINREQVSRLLERVDELLHQNQNQHFTSEIMEVMQKAQKIIEEKMQADMAERMKKIKSEVGKMADDRWSAFMASMNEEMQETERKRKRIQCTIEQIESEIKKEEQKAQPIPSRLERFRASLMRERENMARFLVREMEEEKERMERIEKEKEDLEIWIQEEEQRRLNEEEQNYERFSKHNMNRLLVMLSMFLLGAGAASAPALLAILFPAAQVVEAGLTAKILAGLLGSTGAAEAGSFLGTATVFALRTASVKLAMMAQCSIQ